MRFRVNWMERVQVGSGEKTLAELAEEIHRENPTFERVCEILEAIAEHYHDRPQEFPNPQYNRVRFDV